LPIRAVSAEASREKSVRKGHISTLHLWWARRPLAACRAAVYGSLVPPDQFQPKNGPPEKRASLGRANAAKFLQRHCKYPGNPATLFRTPKSAFGIPHSEFEWFRIPCPVKSLLFNWGAIQNPKWKSLDIY